jgi:dephospho-CoA kinase
MESIAVGKVVLLTGGISTGKSTVRRAFEGLGVPCLDTDSVARTIHQDHTHPATQEVARRFADWMTPSGALQRGSLKALFAQNEAANRTLIEILKPHVLEAIHHWTTAQHVPYVVCESALLTQADIAVDRCLKVEAPVALRIARIKGRNPDWSDQHISNILSMQAALQCSPVATTDVIQNSGSAEQLAQAVEAMHRHYTTLWI